MCGHRFEMIMDIMKKIIYAAVAVLMMSGCSGSLGTEDTPSLEMKFELEYPGVRTKVAASGFVKGDIAGLYMTENVNGEPSVLMQGEVAGQVGRFSLNTLGIFYMR